MNFTGEALRFRMIVTIHSKILKIYFIGSASLSYFEIEVVFSLFLVMIPKHSVFPSTFKSGENIKSIKKQKKKKKGLLDLPFLELQSLNSVLVKVDQSQKFVIDNN